MAPGYARECAPRHTNPGVTHSKCSDCSGTISPMVSQMNAAPPPTRSRRNRVLAIAVIIVVVLGAAIVGAELYARHSVVNCMTDQIEADLGSQVDIGLSAKPVLLQA